ncbi:hypothetical protein JMJ77_0005392 [Colletotrichum scovillei]|uniref:Uncharacterized protein n=1 Tax=Colletotrichum scovillei TaxID=1209932 RepID=A0A9P7RH35_9PEZI|nr:hypothetical protein JMJ77_0005392 [Colletotrichum scovillei]KAG7076609.1 hypothetical protein JMJ76_0013871 [Colletotrichum scovillei]KAG7083716.1 hypothetical protein JMJ78_0009159 [Colletotrichum scovillei]
MAHGQQIQWTNRINWLSLQGNCRLRWPSVPYFHKIGTSTITSNNAGNDDSRMRGKCKVSNTIEVGNWPR